MYVCKEKLITILSGEEEGGGGGVTVVMLFIKLCYIHDF